MSIIDRHQDVINGGVSLAVLSVMLGYVRTTMHPEAEAIVPIIDG